MIAQILPHILKIHTIQATSVVTTNSDRGNKQRRKQVEEVHYSVGSFIVLFWKMITMSTNQKFITTVSLGTNCQFLLFWRANAFIYPASRGFIYFTATLWQQTKKILQSAVGRIHCSTWCRGVLTKTLLSSSTQDFHGCMVQLAK